jgi:hypothetical protein
MRVLSLNVILLCLTVSIVPNASAQWLPLSAKHKQEIYKVLPDGTESVTDEILGTFVRASNGSSLLVTQKVSEGKAIGEKQAVLRDAGSGKIYVLNYAQRRAVIRQQLTLPLAPMKRNLAAGALQLTVNGLPCVEVRVRGSMVLSGQACVSATYDLTVRSDAMISTRGGKIHHSDQFYDIQIGTEPSASSFVVPSGFQIVENPKLLP